MVGRLLTAMDDLSNRLETFVDWPSHVPVKPKNLAEAGFYYVGKDPSDDTVCCFSCDGKLDGWKADDIPEEKHRLHFGSRCEFIRNEDEDVCESASSIHQRNYRRKTRFDPIEDDDMENEEQRIHSFQRNNGWRGAVAPRKLAAAGFYFTGIDDNVKCFACDLNLRCWEPEEDPISEHLKNQPGCPYLSRLISRLDVRSSHVVYTTGISKTTDVFRQSRPNYTETTSVHVRRDPPKMPPDYAREQARLHTFINWPKKCPVQPKELIDAGFYYTGEDDKAKCFQCGVILAGWEPEDTPWGEHQKWSQDCLLVRQHLLQRNPHLPDAGPSCTMGLPREQTWQSTNAQKSFPSTNIDSYKYVNLDPSEEEFSEKMVKGRLPLEQNEVRDHDEEISMKKTKVKEEKEIFHIQKAVQELIDRGYDFGTIEDTIQYKTKVCKESIDSVDELLDAVVSFMAINNGNSNENQNGYSSAKQAGETDCITGETDYITGDSDTISEECTGFSLAVDPETLHQQVKKMQEAHLCKICLDADIGVVFLPCGHLVCCLKCATAIQNKTPPFCPVCRRCIESTIRTYLP